jgi:hypothetical protein
MQALTKIIDSVIEKAMIKAKGRVFAKIFCNWQLLVGESLAMICIPLTIDTTDNVLVIAVYGRTKSLELHFMKEIILTKINMLLARNNLSQNITNIYIKQEMAIPI